MGSHPIMSLQLVFSLILLGQIYQVASTTVWEGADRNGQKWTALAAYFTEKIKTMIDLIRKARWRWTPVKRVYIPKKSGKLRPLGLPSWSSKVMQEVVRQLLEAYFEPTFSDRSHGFRKGARVSYCLERNCVWVEGCPLGHRRRHFRLFWTTRS